MTEFNPPLRKTPPCTYTEVINHYEKQRLAQERLDKKNAEDNEKRVRKECADLVNDHFNRSLYINAYGNLALTDIHRFVRCNKELDPYGWEISCACDEEHFEYYLKKK